MASEVIAAIRDNKRPDFKDDKERMAYEVATEIMTTKELSQAGYDNAVKQFGLQGTVELISTIGYYAMVGIFLKSLRRADARRQHAAEIRERHLGPFRDTGLNELTPENRALYEAVRANRPKLVGPFSVLMNNPPLADAVNQVVDAVRKDGTLDKRLYELIVLIVVRHAGAAYAWAVHDPLARKAGLSGDVVDAIQRQTQAGLHEARREGDLRGRHRAANTNKISDAAYQALIKQFGLAKTIEAITCVGLYCMIGAVINAFEVPTPNGEKPF